MANPLVFFENIYTNSGATVSAATAASGFPASNVTDWRIATPYRWKANQTTTLEWVKVDLGAGNDAQPDTVAIAGHNLFTISESYRTYYSDDDAVWTAAHAAVTPTDDLPSLTTFTVGAAHRYWRVEVQTEPYSAAPQIGIITLGRRLDFTAGAQPDLDPYQDDPVREWSMNENGSPLGANLRFNRKTFSINYDAPGMTDSDFFDPSSGLKFDDDFIPHARDKPFWFAWNVDVDAAEVYLCRAVDPIRMPFIGSTARRGLFTRFEAYREAT